MYKQSVLSNGLRVISHQLKPRDSVGLAIWVRVGGRFEAKSISGISHFVEHMLFKGTKHRTTKQIKEEVEGVGGMLNAFTGEESTCYFVKIPKAHLALAFNVLQDMVNHATLDPKEFNKEKPVILEEIKMYLDLPSQHVHEMMSELLWPEQALGRPIAGTLKSVSNLKRSDLAKHVKSYYHPRNILVTACGEIDHDEIRDLTARHFDRGGNGRISQFPKALFSTHSKKNHFWFLDKKTEQTHFVLGFHGLSRNHPDRYQLALLNVILGANMSSRLFEEVRERRGLAYEIKSGLGFYDDTGSIVISAGVEPRKAPLAIRVIMRELGRFKRKPVTEGELRRAKDYFLGQLLLGLEDTLDHALWYGEHILYGGKLPNLEEIRQKIEQVTQCDIQKLAGRFFKTGGVHLSLIGPLDATYEKKIKVECLCP
ncbi:MAG: insulinase family protein [Candidatus Omnitrophica bacterium]|nr:insulinase family protein [Candidatus Omnitrophota bacterium]